jgi:myxalamid-type polyketide synthase MxaE and MxaD
VALEHPEIWGGLIDLDPEAATGAGLTLATEVRTPEGEDQICYRHGERHVARLMQAVRDSRDNAVVSLADDASYLITGGLGGLGLQVAKWLAAKGARHLILTSRSGLPDRAEWDQVAANSIAAPRIAAIREVEALGAAVTVLKADAGDRTQMAQLFEMRKHSHPPLRGILHCAGTVLPRPLTEIDTDLLRGTLQAKVAGGWILHQLTSEMALDFMIFFSSGAAIWGAAGMAHYAAANHFLDTLAHYRRGIGLPALSINWGWWSGGGIATSELEHYFSEVGLTAIPTAQALMALESLLSSGAIQKTVAAVDWQVFKPIYEAKRRRPLLEHVASQPQSHDEQSPHRFVEQLEAAAADARWDMLLAHVRSEAASVLGFTSASAVDLQQGFFKMGMNSLMTVQLRSRLENSLNCSLPTTIAFEYPTIRALTAYLASQLFATDPAGQVDMTTSSERSESGLATELETLSSEDLLSLFDSELAAANDLVERDSR